MGTRGSPISLEARPGAMPAGLVFLVVALVVAGGVGVFHLDRAPVAFCAFKAVTGIPCLTCGTTRAFGRLVALDLRGALFMNPLASLFALGLVPWGLAELALLPKGRALVLHLSPGAARAARVGAVVLLVVNWGFLIATGR